MLVSDLSPSARLTTRSRVGSVTVTIRNDGEDAYRPEVYGNAIIIERKIRREGSSNYKIKSAKGASSSCRKSGLIDWFLCALILIRRPGFHETGRTGCHMRSYADPSNQSDDYPNSGRCTKLPGQ